MSRAPEARLWQRMKANLEKYPVHLERIENIVGVGMPDVLSICDGLIAWVELKAVVSLPARSTTKILSGTKRLSQDQKNWHMNWHKNGGQSYILIGVGSRDFWFFDGRCADFINDWNFSDMALSCYTESNWETVACLLGY